MIAATPLHILKTALEWIERGEAVALVTLVGIEGTSSRALGTQMAICASGECIGSFSGGCIEAAIVAEAQAVLRLGRGRQVRYGIGSPYIDVRLPCGGGIDLLFTPHPAMDLLRHVLEKLALREAVRLGVLAEGLTLKDHGFALWLYPPLRILAFGQGEDLLAFMRLSHGYGAKIEGFTPSIRDMELAGKSALTVTRLTHTSRAPTIRADRWTAIILLFHDRDWEDALLPDLLAHPAFFKGAVGSRNTHRARLDRLRHAGIAEETCATLTGQIGLIPATRDPMTLAISILAQLAAHYASACPPMGDPLNIGL